MSSVAQLQQVDEPASTGGGGALAGTGTLLRFLLRRDRVKLPAWAGGVGLLILYLVTAIPAAYGDDADLEAIGRMFADPVARLLVGPGYGFDAPTIERLVANGYGLYVVLLTALMSILLVTRHTRLEEQTGRAELVRANVLGRHAALTATLIVAALTNLAAGLLIVLVVIGIGGYPTGGTVLFAAGAVVGGLSFAGLTAVTVQLTSSSRAAAGLAGVGVGAAFVLRAGGDLAEVGGSTLSWLSPLAWPQQTAPFVLDRWWPLTLSLGFAVVTIVVGYLLSARRDLGASLLAVRPGAATAAPWLGTPLGLAWRLQRPAILGWGTALVAAGLVFGAYADPMLSGIGDMPEVLAEVFGSPDDLLGGYLAYITVFMSYVVAMFAVLAVQGLRGEETAGRLEPVLATPVGRATWLLTNLAVTAGAVVVLLGVTGLATAVGVLIVTGDAGSFGDLLVAHLNQVPAVLVVLGLAAALLGVLPRAVPAVWAVVGYGLVVGTFGAMLDLPAWAFDLSPFEHPAVVPLEPVAAVPLLLLLALAGGLVAVGLLGLRRRSIQGP